MVESEIERKEIMRQNLICVSPSGIIGMKESSRLEDTKKLDSKEVHSASKLNMFMNTDHFKQMRFPSGFPPHPAMFPDFLPGLPAPMGLEAYQRYWWKMATSDASAGNFLSALFNPYAMGIQNGASKSLGNI